MKNIFKLLSVLLLIVSLSCNDSENLVVAKDSSTKETATSFNGPPSSAKVYNDIGNPYEYVGQQHNDFLDYLGDQQNTYDQQGIVSLYYQYANVHNLNIAQYMTESEMNSNLIFDSNHSFNFYLYQLHNQGKLSNLVLNELLPLGNAFEQIHENNDFPVLINTIQNLEAHYLSLNINESDKAVLLSTISVAKYSSNYWYEGFIQTGGSSRLSLTSLLNTLANVIAIIVGDSIAAIAGAGIGVGLSALTGGATAAAIPTLTVAFAAAASGFIGTHPPF